MKNHPHTLVTRFLGMHRVEMGHIRRKVRFIIMGSVFATEETLHTTFDLKGSTAGRFAKKGETLDILLKPENKAKLVDILTYHVVAGAAVFAKDLKNDEQIKTVEGKAVTAHVSGTSVKINDATVTTANVAASNGVVHIIDTVLLPPAMLAEVEFEFTAVIE